MKGYLPEATISKKKHGFGLPIGLWLRDSATVRELIHGNLQQLRRRHIVRDDVIDRVLGLHGSEDASYYGVFLWVLAMLEQWLQEHGHTI
jgi:asparagine synthase (glutamine-hydrolysing)